MNDRVVFAETYFETLLPLSQPMSMSAVDDDPDAYGVSIERDEEGARRRLLKAAKADSSDVLYLDGWIYLWVGGKKYFGGGWWEPPVQTWGLLLDMAARFVTTGAQSHLDLTGTVDCFVVDVTGTGFVRFSCHGESSTVPRVEFLTGLADEGERVLRFVEDVTGMPSAGSQGDIATIRAGVSR
jgi:hypothetical protein